MFSGNETARSTNDRVASKARAPTRVRPLNSGTSVVKSLVTSIAAALPFDDTVAGGLSAVAGAKGGLGDLAHPQEFAAQAILRNLVVDPVFDAMNRENAVVGLRILGNHALVRPDFRLRRAPAAA